MTDFVISIRSLRSMINLLNVSIINQSYDQVSAELSKILPYIQFFFNDKVSLSRILVNFDYHGLFSYIFLMNQENLDLTNAIYFLQIAFKAEVYDPKYFINKQNVLLIFSLLNKYSSDPQIISILLSILCKLTTPYSLSYILFVKNDLFQLVIDMKHFFPISHILYHIVLSSFYDNYKIEKKYSSSILQSAIQTLQSQTSFYENEHLFHEEVAFSLKILAIYIKHSTFPIDFNTNILISNRAIYLKGPEIIQESFLDFLNSYDNVNIKILNEIIPFFIDKNKKSSLFAIEIFKKSLFEQVSDSSDESDEDANEEKSDGNEPILSLFPILQDVICELYRVEPKIVQDEAFPIIVELCNQYVINLDIFLILCTRIRTEYATIQVIGKLINEFSSDNKDQIGFLNKDIFYQILNHHLNDLNLSISSKSFLSNPNYDNQLIPKICQSINSYIEAKKQL